MKNLSVIKLSYLYAFASIVLLLALPFLSSKLFPVQIACFDIEPTSAYQYTEIEMVRIPTQEVISQYHNNASFLLICAGTVIVLGVLLLRSIYNHKQSIKRKQRTILNILIVTTLLSYGLVLAFAGLEIWCSSS